jgi:branched-chain amino acid aminotransferase
MKTGAGPMSNEMTESYFILNGRILHAAEYEKLPKPASRTLYEVIRVISGTPIFLERHMDRLEASARLVGSTVSSIADNIRDSIKELIRANNSPESNIKILAYNLESNTPDYMVYFIHSSYPTAEEYRKGVHAVLLREERSNPNAKIVNSGFKERVAEVLASTGAYEALLVNGRNEITEGSRSNLFFVKNNMVYTAPKDSVLIGITRVCIFELCEKQGVKIQETPITVPMLTEMDGVFMTGTSPKLLPISTIDELHFGSAGNPVIKALMKGYDDMLEEYIENHK